MRFRRLSSSFRIVLGLVSLAVSSLLVAGLLGLIPNVGTSAQENRSAFCEASAVSFMALAPRMNAEQIQTTFDTIRTRNAEVESIAVRTNEDGSLLFQSGPHEQIWETIGSKPECSREFIVPISSGEDDWGQLEIRFREVAAGPFGAIMRPEFTLSIFLAVCLFVSFTIYLRRVLKHLNPSQVIPPRVREALDALAEGLLVLDNDLRIVLANGAFATHMHMSVEELLAKTASDLGFRVVEDHRFSEAPWAFTAKTGQSRRSVLMKLGMNSAETNIFRQFGTHP